MSVTLIKGFCWAQRNRISFLGYFFVFVLLLQLFFVLV